MVEIDVIIPFHRPLDKFLFEAIDSVRNSVGVKARPLLVNNCVSDLESTRQLRQMGLKVIEEKKLGYGNSLNAGILNSTSEFISILNSDDVSAPERLKLQTKMLKVENTNLSITRIKKFGKKLKYYDLIGSQPKRAYYKEFLMLGAYGANASLTGKSDFFKNNLFIDTELTDWEYAFRNFSSPMSYIDKPLYFYRMHSNQVTRQAIQLPPWLPQVWRQEFSKISRIQVTDQVIFAMALPAALAKLDKTEFLKLQEVLVDFKDYFDSVIFTDYVSIKSILIRRLIASQLSNFSYVDLFFNHKPFESREKFLELFKFFIEVFLNFNNINRSQIKFNQKFHI
jgi:glycosyltransferase involved in cell wall biosynthesis